MTFMVCLCFLLLFGFQPLDIMGQYIFINGHDIKIKDSMAVINSAAFSLDTSSNLTFWYSMNGVGIGKLVLSRLEGKKKEDLWERKGRQGRGWMRGFVMLHPGEMRLQFSATASLPYSSDIALDDIQLDSESTHFDKGHCKLTTTTTTTTTVTTRITTSSASSTPVHTTKPPIPTNCPIAGEQTVVLPGSCDFEKDLCGNKLSSNMSAGRFWRIEWERTQKTQYNGAARIDGDHTKQQDEDSRGYYMNFKNGLGTDHGDTIAIIETPAINTNLACLTFWYNMLSKYSNLKVSVKHEKLIREVWKREEVFSGRHLGWHKVSVVIREEPPYSIFFQTYNKEYQAYIGIDDILIIGANQSDSSTSSLTESTTTLPTSITLTNYMAKSDRTEAQTQSSTSDKLFSNLTTTDISRAEITSRPSSVAASWSSLNNNQSTLSPSTMSASWSPLNNNQSTLSPSTMSASWSSLNNTQSTLSPSTMSASWSSLNNTQSTLSPNITEATNSHAKSASSTVSGLTTGVVSSLSGFFTRNFETSTLSSTIFKAASSKKSSISLPSTETTSSASTESSSTLSSKMTKLTDSPEITNKSSRSTIRSTSTTTESSLPYTTSLHTVVGVSSEVTQIPTLLSTTNFAQTSGGTIESSTLPPSSPLSSVSVINNVSQSQPTSTSKVTSLNTTSSSLSSTARSSAISRSTEFSKDAKKTELVMTTIKYTKAPKPTTFTKNKKTKSDKLKQNSEDENDLSSAAIAGIVVGSVCVVTVIGLMFYFLVLKSNENRKTVGDKALPANGKVYHTNGNLPSENGKTDYMNGNAHNMKNYMNGSVNIMRTEILLPSEINLQMINERTYSTKL